MDNVKVSLTIVVPGATMYSTQECVKQLKQPVINKTGKYVGKQARDKKGRLVWKYKEVPDNTKLDVHTLKVDKEVLNFTTRKCKPVLQVINICDEAYNAFISDEFPATFKASESKGSSYNQYVWEHMTPEARLKWHLSQIAETLGGYIKDYVVFED